MIINTETNYRIISNAVLNNAVLNNALENYKWSLKGIENKPHNVILNNILKLQNS